MSPSFHLGQLRLQLLFGQAALIPKPKHMCLQQFSQVPIRYLNIWEPLQSSGPNGGLIRTLVYIRARTKRVLVERHTD